MLSLSGSRLTQAHQSQAAQFCKGQAQARRAASRGYIATDSQEDARDMKLRRMRGETNLDGLAKGCCTQKFEDLVPSSNHPINFNRKILRLLKPSPARAGGVSRHVLSSAGLALSFPSGKGVHNANIGK